MAAEHVSGFQALLGLSCTRLSVGARTDSISVCCQDSRIDSRRMIGLHLRFKDLYSREVFER